MRPVDPMHERALALIDRLRRGGGIVARWLGADRDRLAALDELRALGRPEIASWMSDVLLGLPHALLVRAARTQGDLLASAEPRDVPRLIAQAQIAPPGEGAAARSRRWSSLTPATIVALARHLPATAAVLTMATGHRSGYVREASVRALAAADEAFVLAALAERLNDWTPQVRQAAREIVERRLDGSTAAAVLRALPVFTRLERRSRDDHAGVLARVRTLLAGPAARADLERALDSPDAELRRHAFATLLACEAGSPSVLSVGLASRDPWVRSRAAAAVQRAVDDDRVAALVPRMQSDPLRQVRQAAIEALATHQGAAAADRITGFLADPSPTIRQFARFYLARWRPLFDAATWYRDQLPSGAHTSLRGVVAGLAETGTRADAQLIAPFVAAPRRDARAVAWRALDRLLDANEADAFLPSLHDRAMLVRTIGARALARRAQALSPQRIDVLLRDDSSATRMVTLLVVASRPLFERLALLLRACRDQDAAVATRAGSMLRDDLRSTPSGYRLPSAEEDERLLSALDDATPALRRDVAAFLVVATGRASDVYALNRSTL